MKVKKVILIRAALLITLATCIGSADNAKAIDISLPGSIHDLLSAEQVDQIKNSQELSDIKNGIRGDVMTEQAQNRPLIGLVNQEVGLKIGAAISSQTRNEHMAVQMQALADPASPDGMPVKIAPGPF
ncbi:MAG: hypothetical protein WGN25_14575 [Candidatus Electrothrix sp. GW3-4]|uniref:hypothetical protein n=1 Tax=Candidatus Electrothrix sp. GW3-4 TaxID=3126740 RepID=UPI0030D24AFE